MSEIHLSDLSKIYKEQIVEKKDDSYLEPDMKKRQTNNEKARKEMAKVKGQKNPHFEEKQKESDIAKSLADAYRAVHEEGYGAPGHNPGSGEKSVARAKALMDKKGQKGAPGLDAMMAANKEHKARRGVKKEEVEDVSEADSLAAMAARREKRLVAQRKREGTHDDGSDFGHDYVAKRREANAKFGKKPSPKNEALDPVGQEDGDIDNDGDKDKSDKYLAKRRKAIGKAIKGKMKKEEFIPEVMTDSEDDKPIKEKKVKNVIKVNPKLGESVEEIGGELIEAVEIVDILEEITDQELRFVSDRMIDEVVEEFFIEAAEQDEDLEVLQQNLCESIDLSISLLLEQDAGAEARKRLGSGPSRASVMDRVKSAVKKGAKVARKAVVKGSEVAGKAVGHAKNLAKDMGSAAKKGYQSTQSGSSDSSSSSDSGTSSSSSSSAPKKKGPGLLSRIGAKLKRGIGKAARAVSRGSRNLARKMDEAVYGGTPPEKKDTRMVVTNADKKANTVAYQKMKAGDKRYKAADHMGEDVKVDEAMMAGPRKDVMKKKEYSAKSGSDRATAFNIGTRRDVSVSDPKIKSRGGRTDKRTGEGDRGMGNAAKRRMKEDASMSPQEIQLQKKKAMLDRMIAQRRQQGLTKAKATESPAKAVGEETEDSLKDRRMERGGVDGNNRYKSAPKNVAMGGGKKKPYDGMSALEKVKASIRAKHGQGAIKEDAKMAKQSDEKLAALHKQVSGSDQSLPSNQFMMKRVTKEMNRRKKAT
ncbi:hypothetical protein OAA64_00370 [bacterium]|nr:hypothetical protein [bacterium]